MANDSTNVEAAPKIDLSDACFSIQIGDGVKRSLIRHFQQRLQGVLRRLGINPDDGALIKADVLEREAWRLADRAISDARLQIDDVLDSAIHLWPGRPAQAWLGEYLTQATSQAWREFLDDGLSFDTFLAVATDAPVAIEGCTATKQEGEP